MIGFTGLQNLISILSLLTVKREDFASATKFYYTFLRATEEVKRLNCVQSDEFYTFFRVTEEVKKFGLRPARQDQLQRLTQAK